MATEVQSTIPVPTTAGPPMTSAMPARHKSKNRVVTNKDRKRSDYYDDVFEPATPPPSNRQQHARSGRQDNRSDRPSRTRPSMASDVFEPNSNSSANTPQARRTSKTMRQSARSDSRGGHGMQGYHHVATMGWRGGPNDPRQGSGASQMPRVLSSPRPPSSQAGQQPWAGSRASSRGASSGRPREPSVAELTYPPSPVMQRPPQVQVPAVHSQMQYPRHVSVSGRYNGGGNGLMSSPMEGAPSTPTYVVYPSHSMATCEPAGSPLVAASPQYAPCVQGPIANQPQAGVPPSNGYGQQVSYCCNCSLCVTAQAQPNQCQQMYVYGAPSGQQVPGQMVTSQQPTPMYYQSGGSSISYSTANAVPASAPQPGSVVSQQSVDGGQYKTSAVYTVPMHAGSQCCTAENSGTHPAPIPTATPTPEVQHLQQQRPQDMQRGGNDINSPALQSAGMYSYPQPSVPRCGYPPESAQVQSPNVFYYPSPQAEVPQHPYHAVQQVTTPTETAPRSYSSSELPVNLNLSSLPPGLYKIVQNGVVQSYVQVGGQPTPEQMPVASPQPQAGYYPAQVPVHPDESAQRHGSVAQQGHIQGAASQEQVQQQIQQMQSQQQQGIDQQQQQQHQQQQSQQMYASPQPMDPRRGPLYQGDASKQPTPTYIQGPSPSPILSPFPNAYQPPSSGGCSYADHPDPNIHLKPGLLTWTPHVYDAPTRFVYPAHLYHGVPQMRMMAPYPMTAGCYPGGIRPMTAARAREYGEYTYDSDGERDGNSSSSTCSTCDSELEEGSVDEQTEALASLMDKYIDSVYDEDTASPEGDAQKGDDASRVDATPVTATAAKTDTGAEADNPKGNNANQKSGSTDGKELSKNETSDAATDDGKRADVESVAASSNETRCASVSSSSNANEQPSSGISAQAKSKDIDIVAATAALKMLLNISHERKSAAASKMAMSISVKNSVSCYELESQMNTVTVESYSASNEIQAISVSEACVTREGPSPDCDFSSEDNHQASKATKGSDSTSMKSKSSLGAEDGDIESGDDDASGWCTEEEVEEMDEENMLYEEEVFARYATQKTEPVLKTDKKKKHPKRTESEKYDDVFEDENEHNETGGFDTASMSKHEEALKGGKRKSSSDGKSSTEQSQDKDEERCSGENCTTTEGTEGNDESANTSMELVLYSKSSSRRNGKEHGGKNSRTCNAQVIYHVSANGQIFPSRSGYDVHVSGGVGQHSEIRFSAGGGCMAAFPGEHGTLRYVVQNGGHGSNDRAGLQPVYNNAAASTFGVNGFVQHAGTVKVQELYGEESLESNNYVPQGQLRYVCSGCQGNGCCEGSSEGIGPIPAMTEGYPKGQGYKYFITGHSWSPELVHQCPESSSCNGDCDNWGNVVYVNGQSPRGSGCLEGMPQTPSRSGDDDSSVRGYTPEREWFRSISEECGEDTEVLVEPAANVVGTGLFGDGVFPGRNFRWGNYPRPPLIHDYEVILPPTAHFPEKRRSSSRTSSTGSSCKDGPKHRKSRSKNARPDECNIS